MLARIKACRTLEEMHELKRVLENELRSTKQKMKLMVYDNYERLLANIDKMGQTDEHLGALQEHLSKTFKADSY